MVNEYLDQAMMNHYLWQAKRQRRLNIIGAVLCVVAGVLGFLNVILYLGNHGTVTPFYTWLANL